MQTTLLGLAIAFILALVAALVGPYFIDWNQFRPQFEAEATRVIGAPVRVGGELDARLLPTPSLRLRSVAIGSVQDATKVGADKLDVEFSLGSLLRGEWRATELTLNGFNLDLSLDNRGRIVWPLSSASNLGALTIDRLNLTGRVALHDAASRATVVLDDIAFAGDVRAQAMAARGDGNFRVGDVRYPFRLSSGRSADGAGMRLHLAIDPGARPFGVDLDGVVTAQAQVPRFEGAMTFTRAIALRTGDASGNVLQTPWKLSAKVTATPSSAKFDGLEAIYGTDEVGLKLTGAAEITFGASPSLRAALSARQLDADRLLAKETANTEPTRLLPGLRSLVAAVPAPQLAARIAIDADQVTLGGRPVQDVAANVHSEAGTWIVDRFEARAPGGTNVVLSGRLTAPGDKANFSGDLKVEASDPQMLAVWLRGSGDASLRLQQPLHAAGRLNVAPDRIALESFKAEIEGDALDGRLALSERAGSGGQRGGMKLDAALTAPRADFDAVTGLGRAFAGPHADWPDEAEVSLDIGRATVDGQQVSPLSGRIGYGPTSLTLTNLKVGGAGGVMLEGNGAFDRTATIGRLDLNAAATSLPQMTAFLSPILPLVATTRLGALPQVQGPAKLKLSLDLDKADNSDRANARVALDLDAPQLKGVLRASATPAIKPLQTLDLDALTHSEIHVDSRLAADRGVALLTLLGLDRMVAAGDGAAQFEASATGVWKAPLRFKAKLSGTNLDADAEGTASPWALGADDGNPKGDIKSDSKGDSKDDPKARQPQASVTLAARKLDVAPLFNIKPGQGAALTLSMASRLTVDGRQFTFDGVDSTVGGSRVRGHVVLTGGEQLTFAGELGMDTLNFGTAFGLAIGATGRGVDEPLNGGPLQGARGQIAFQALRGNLPGGVEMRSVSGVLKGNGVSLSLADLKGTIGGGTATADITTSTGRDGLAIDARVQLAGVDGPALNWRGLAMPTGRTSLQMTLASRGRSADALTGALSGNGALTIDNARIAGLDPRVFGTAIAASDAGQVTDDRKLRDMVVPALDAGSLAVASVQIPFNIRDGSLRVTSTALEGDSARAIVSGGYDIIADQADLRASLVSTIIGTANNRPEIQIFAHGPPDHLDRTVDVTLLSSWLAVRTIDRETRRLDALERGAPAAMPAPPTTATVSPPTATVAPDTPPSAVPLPSHDPRQHDQKAMVPATAPTTAPTTAPAAKPSAPHIVAPAPPPSPSPSPPAQAANAPALQPLPPPIDVHPAPGMMLHPKPRPRPPLMLAPPIQN